MTEKITKQILKNRDEWLKARRKTIGGSDAASVVGMNPYMSNQLLFDIKTGAKIQEDISEKTYVKFGVAAEPLMREMFALDYPEYDVMYEENNLFRNSIYPFAHASLDGWLIDQSKRRGILEIKTTSILNSAQKQKWIDGIPDNYYVQLLHNIFVYDADFAILKARIKTELKDGLIYAQIKHYYIEKADVICDINFLIEQEIKFSDYLKSGRRPPLILPNL